MKCAQPLCRGTTNELRCDIHGDICSECALPCTHHREDRKCGRCGARSDGAACADCTSPWVYMTFHEDGKWRCRMCVLNIIRDRGYEESEQELQARIDAVHAKAQQEQAEKEAKVLEQIELAKEKKARRMAKKEPVDNLFTLQDSKKKKKK